MSRCRKTFKRKLARRKRDDAVACAWLVSRGHSGPTPLYTALMLETMMDGLAPRAVWRLLAAPNAFMYADDFLRSRRVSYERAQRYFK